jgi:hypothetical protein
LYTAHNIIKEDKKRSSMHGRHAYKMLVGKPEGKRPFGKPRHRWVDNIRIVLRERRWEGVD